MTIATAFVNLIMNAVTIGKQRKRVEHKTQDTDDGEFEIIENLQEKIVNIREGTGVIIVKKENTDKD